MTTDNINALLLVPNEYGVNYYLNKDDFELLGWNLTRVGTRQRIAPCPDSALYYANPSLKPDLLVSEITDLSAYDALVIMPATKSGSSSYGDLLKSQEALDLIASATQEGLAVHAGCGGVRVLAAAGILDGKEITGAPAFQEEYQAAGAIYLGDGLPPVIHDNIVTTRRDLYYHRKNSQAIMSIIEGAQNPADTPDEKEVRTIATAVEERDTLWTVTYGGIGAEGGRSVAETSDGGFIIAGYTYSFGAGQADAYLIKTDAQGNAQWSRAFGGPGWEYGFSVAQSPDGGYVLTGYTTSFGAGSKDVYVVKTDPQGQPEWEKTFGGPALDVGQSIAATSDGGYIIVGYTESFGAGEDDLYMIKTDAQGDEEWSKTYGGTGPEMGGSVQETSDDGYIIAGATGSFGQGNQDVYLIKTDASGNEAWSRTFAYGEGVHFDWGNSARETSDGGYVVIGESNATPDGLVGELMNFFLVKTDARGNETWSRTAGRTKFYDYGHALREAPDGGFFALGTAKSASDNNDIYLVRFDAQGNILWKKAFGDRGSEWGSAMTVTREGDLVIVGHTDSFGAGTFDVWLLKVPGDEIE